MKAVSILPRLRQRMQHIIARSQPPAVEDSVWLRILIQALVSVGILATDVAASTSYSLWAIPLSGLGATWSWYGRRRRNIAAKFGIAFGMLAVLGMLFAKLLGNAGDSRLLLAELLIQLQVLHTFDLPRRKDLGYSAVIGLILIGVAATMSETMAFGGFLILFVAIALPVLLLDYRARLGLGTLRLQPRAFLPPRQIAVLLGIILGLGLLIFAITPRLPGYQFRTFPVSGEVELQGKFQPGRVFNPGYVNSGKGLGQGGQQKMGQGSTPTFNPKFYYGFNAEISQNLRGVLKPEMVMRVRSQSAGFWRVMGFDQYTGQGWKVSLNDAAKTIQRPSWSYRFVLPILSPQSRTQEVVQTFSILTEFPNVLPALTQAREVYFPSQEIALDAEGGLRSPSGLDQGLTYSVVSDVSYRDRTRLNRAKSTYPTGIQGPYLQIPVAITPQIRQITAQLLAKSTRPLNTPYETALYLTQALKQRYTLQDDVPSLPEGQDLVENFLTQWQGGNPDHFASTLTIMLRSIGIPARLATGFGPGKFNAFTGLYEVQNTDAYAISEVYFPGNGWFAFDPIPGHELYPPSVELDQSFSVLRQFWNWVAGWLPSPIAGWLNGAIAGIAMLLAQILQQLGRGWQGFLFLVMTATMMGVSLWGLWQAWQAGLRFWDFCRLPPMARLYQQMLQRLAEEGFQKHPTETPWEYARQIQRAYPTPQAEIVGELTQAYVEWRYGNRTPDLHDLRKRWQLFKNLRVKMGKAIHL